MVLSEEVLDSVVVEVSEVEEVVVISEVVETSGTEDEVRGVVEDGGVVSGVDAVGVVPVDAPGLQLASAASIH